MTLRITIFGGTGFLGGHIVRELAKEGHVITVVSRYPDRALHLKTAGMVGQIALVPGNILDEASVQRAISKSDAVINLVGILHERGHQRFAAIHAQGAERIAKIASQEGIEHLLHISALGIDHATGSHYARSKLNGEKAVLAAFPKATIFRPSILFGPEDHFFNRFAQLAKILPVMPIIGDGKTLLQPVYAGDVARAAKRVLENPSLQGTIYELGGPEQYSFIALMRFILEHIGRSRPFVYIPYELASIMAAFLEWLPNPPLTRDQIKLLKVDNIANESAEEFKELGIIPSSIKAIVPSYLVRFRK